MIPRCAEELFAGLDDIEELEEVTIRCSFLEIYKEVIQDLLNPSNVNLRIREEKNGEVYVQGLSDEYVSSADDIMQLLAVGEKSRTVASTDMNEVSSRSHSVLILVVHQKLKDGSTRVGKLNMADLAGSERIERTNATGVTLEEAKMINQSLSALGNCINALTDSKRTHIPFRDSTLTFLLKDSLGGNTKTTLLVCCSGEDSDIPETLSTLNFAKRAKRIKNNASVNTVMGVKELTVMVEGLKRELALATRQIVALQRVVKMLREGGGGGGGRLEGGVDEAMLEQLMRPPALGAGKGEGEGGKALASRPPSPVSTSLSALNTPAITAPSSPVLSPTLPTSTSLPDLASPPATTSPLPLSPSLVPPSEPRSDDADGVVDIAQIQRMISSAKEEARALNADLDPASSQPTTSSPASAPSSALVPPSSLAPPTSPSPTTSDASPSPTPSADAVRLLEEKLVSERAEYKKKARSWQLEVTQLRVEKEMLRVSARASDALINNLSNTVRAQKEREAKRAAAALALHNSPSSDGAPHPDSDGDESGEVRNGSSSSSSHLGDDYVSELLAKNARLETQMADMKHTWTAYLELMMETQKIAAQRKEAKERERQRERERRERDVMLFADPPPAHRTKIVKPVRVGGGGGEARFFSPPKVAVPVGASPLALPPPASAKEDEEGKAPPTPSPPPLHPTPPVRKYSGSRASTGISASTSTPPSGGTVTPPGHTPNSSITSSILSSLLDTGGGGAGGGSGGKPSSPFLPSSDHHSRSSTLHDVLKRGYLYKKQMGWSMSMSAQKTWRKRLVLLRHHCIDYYEHPPPSTITPLPLPPLPSSAASPPPPTSDSPSSPPLPAPFLSPLSSLQPPLTGSLRGTIPLDPTTLVRLVDYGDVAWGFEIVTRDKEAKLHASSVEERDEWVEEVKKVVYRIRRGAGMKDEEIERLEQMQSDNANHPSRAVEL